MQDEITKSKVSRPDKLGKQGWVTEGREVFDQVKYFYDIAQVVIVNHWAELARSDWPHHSTSCPQETAPAHLCPTRSNCTAQHRHHTQIQLEKILASVVRNIQRNNNNGNWSHFFVRYNTVPKAGYIWCCWKLISLFYLIFIKQLLTMILKKNVEARLNLLYFVLSYQWLKWELDFW